MAKPYRIYIDDLEIPVTPAEIEESVGSNNDFYNLLNGDTYSALRKSKPSEWNFEFYAFSKPHPSVDLFVPQDVIKTKLKDLKKEKTVFEFIVLRSSSDINLKNSLCKYMLLEDFRFKENADWGTNIKISLTLKEVHPVVTTKLEQGEQGLDKNVNYEKKEDNTPRATSIIEINVT